MTSSDQYKRTACFLLLLGAVPFGYCLVCHWHGAGLLAYDRIDFIADFFVLGLISLGLLCSLKVRGRKRDFYILLVLSLVLMMVQVSFIALFPYLAAIYTLYNCDMN